VDIYLNQYKWVSVSLVDGMIYEGTIEAEVAYGLYLYVGGQESRLTLFPWHTISRVIFKQSY